MTTACATPEAELVLSEQNAVLDYRAGSWATMVTAGGDWTLSPDAPYDWITPSKLQGKMGDLISFTLQTNLSGSDRSALYRIQSGSQSREISILQEAKPEVRLPDSFGAFKHVVIIGVDGGGAFFKDTYTPNMDAIFADGSFTYDWRAVSPSISAQNWGAMLHGVLEKRNLLEDTLFMVVTDHGGTPGGSHGGNSNAEMIIFFGAAGKTVDKDTPIVDGDNRDVAFDALPLRIGQDGTGAYSDHLAAQLDEFILTADILSDEDIAALKSYYQ